MSAFQLCEQPPLPGGRCQTPTLSRAIAAMLGAGMSLPAISLAQETQQLAPVVVTAAGFEQEIDEAPASVTIITREELEQRRVTNLAEALRGIEGVNVSPLDALGGVVNIYNNTLEPRRLFVSLNVDF